MAAGQMRDAGLEGAQLLWLAALSFRDQDQDRTVGKSRITAGERIALTGADLSGQGNDSDDLEGEPCEVAALEKIVRRCHWSQVAQHPLREQAHQHERVEMAVVV